MMKNLRRSSTVKKDVKEFYSMGRGSKINQQIMSIEDVDKVHVIKIREELLKSQLSIVNQNPDSQ